MTKKLLFTVAASVLAATSGLAADPAAQPKLTAEQQAAMQQKIQEMLAKRSAPKLPVMELAEAKKYFSYNIGVNMGSQLKNDKMVITEEFLAGLKKALAGEAKAEDIDPQKMQAAQMAMQKEAQRLAEIEAKKDQAKGVEYLVANKKKDGVKVTASGLQYKVVKEGKGAAPTASDQVKVHYTGSLVDGKVFDSSVKRGTPAVFGVGQVIPGWIEGLQLMKPGAKYEFVIPQEIGYGARGAGQNIPPFATLKFEVELLEVIKPAVKSAPKSK